VGVIAVVLQDGEDPLVSKAHIPAKVLDATMVDEYTCLDVPNNKIG
jgi:hypothetical protein